MAGLRRERTGGTAAEAERDGRGFTPDEWRLILGNALKIGDEPGRRGPTLLGAIRWVPWIQAYSGARPGEIVQLRREDFGQEDGIHFFHIRESAGPMKTGLARRVPIHEHLIEQGLLEFVGRAKQRHIFANVLGDDDAAIRRGIDTARGRVGDWVREIGVKDPNISPNHAWRHTFTTRAREASIQEYVFEAICGWSKGKMARRYGSVTLTTRAEAIATFPRYDLREGNGRKSEAAGSLAHTGTP